jgi:DNA-binding MarR family transcriptional regulator
MPDIPMGEYLCTDIKRAEQALMAHHEAVLRRYGLTMTQYTVLLSLSREAGLSGTQLARACGVTQQTMASVLAGLHAKALVQRTTSAVHARVQLYSLTKAGKAALAKAYAEVASLEQALTDAFSAKERSALCALLERATAVLVEQTPTTRG